jgi:hypothetical protein
MVIKIEDHRLTICLPDNRSWEIHNLASLSSILGKAPIPLTLEIDGGITRFRQIAIGGLPWLDRARLVWRLYANEQAVHHLMTLHVRPNRLVLGTTLLTPFALSALKHLRNFPIGKISVWYGHMSSTESWGITCNAEGEIAVINDDQVVFTRCTQPETLAEDLAATL